MSKKGLEIKEEIHKNNELIKSYLTPDSFVLNNAVSKLLSKNAELRKGCPHEFNEEGYCIYCYEVEK